MSKKLKTAHVFADLAYFPQPLQMGLLHYQPAAAGGLFSFEYDGEWLKAKEAISFDPDLSLVSAQQYPTAERISFGIFLDSSPDRWGRVLMQRRENTRARHAQRKPFALTEWDFLLGVHDETRLGALRFRLTKDGPFIDDDKY